VFVVRQDKASFTDMYQLFLKSVAQVFLEELIVTFPRRPFPVRNKEVHYRDHNSKQYDCIPRQMDTSRNFCMLLFKILPNIILRSVHRYSWMVRKSNPLGAKFPGWSWALTITLFRFYYGSFLGVRSQRVKLTIPLYLVPNS